MESICELHDDDTEIIHHSDKHLAKTLDSSLFSSILDGRELGQSFTDVCYITTEFFFYIIECLWSVFDNIMEDTTLDRYHIWVDEEEELRSLQ